MVPEDGSIEGSPFSDPVVREQVRELPPSTTLIAWILADQGPLSIPELAEESLLARSTVRAGLSQLRAADLLESHRRSADSHTRVYDIRT